jgi:hypothetical protein
LITNNERIWVAKYKEREIGWVKKREIRKVYLVQRIDWKEEEEVMLEVIRGLGKVNNIGR